MKSVIVKVRGTAFELGADNPSRLELLAHRYDARVSEVIQGLGRNVSDLKAVIVTSLMMEDQIDTLSQKVDASNENYKLEAENTRAEMEQLRKNFAQTVGQLCDYLDHLSDQIAKR
jgi:cell division protein ZapA (FtsZ GTPase activity inhibitor)